MGRCLSTEDLLKQLVERLALSRPAGAMPLRAAQPGRSFKTRYSTDRVLTAGRPVVAAGGTTILNTPTHGGVTIYAMVATGNTNGWLTGAIKTGPVAVTDEGPEVIFQAGINVNQSQFVLPVPPQGIFVPDQVPLQVASAAGGNVAFTFLLDRYIPVG